MHLLLFNNLLVLPDTLLLLSIFRFSRKLLLLNWSASVFWCAKCSFIDSGHILIVLINSLVYTIWTSYKFWSCIMIATLSANPTILTSSHSLSSSNSKGPRSYSWRSSMKCSVLPLQTLESHYKLFPPITFLVYVGDKSVCMIEYLLKFFQV